MQIAVPLFIFILLSASPLLVAEQVSDQFSPESSHENSFEASSKILIAQNHIAVTAHPLASDVAHDILAQGGNAIDAAIAAQFMLGLVEPQSSGIGGGAFLVYYDAKLRTIETFDGREVSPSKVNENLFLNGQNKPMNFFDAVIGGRSVGVPGTVMLLGELHKEKGSISWRSLLEPTIRTATKGFTVTPRLAAAVSKDLKRLKSDKTTHSYFAPNGKPLNAGARLKNPEYAQTLTLLSENGYRRFYTPPLSSNIIDKVNSATNPGFLTQQDFDRYKIVKRDPICTNYRSYKVCGMGPPSSGQITIAQILGIVENFNLNDAELSETDRWQIISDASQLAFADRGKYIADPAFTPFNDNLLSKSYLKNRSKQIQIGNAIPSVKPGIPLNQQSNLAYAKSPELPSTTHLVIVDKQGNIVSMTSTIENGFGSRLMVDGYLLNNELTDFSFSPSVNKQLVANRVEPIKRPRSSMAPTIVLKDNKPVLAIGSPGGSRIINYVANTLVRMIDFKLPLLDAINSRHIVNRFGALELEKGAFSDQEIDDYTKRGYKVVEKDLNSGIHAVLLENNELLGAADKRREGVAKGI